MLTVSGAEVDEERLAAICDRYGIAEMKVFGSQARSAAGPDSDIDLLYTLKPGRRLGWEINQLEDELTDLFGRRVDLVSAQALHPLLRRSVLADARPLYAAAPLGRQRYLQAREKPRNLISPVGQLYIAEYLMPGDVPARLQPGQHPAATWCASATRPSPAKRRTSSR